MGDVFQDAARQDVALQAYRDVLAAVLKNVTDSRADRRQQGNIKASIECLSNRWEAG